MPAKTTTSGVIAKLGSKFGKAFNQHKNNEVNYGGGTLPAGIELGIAQLVDMKIDVYKTGENKGKEFFYMAGVVQKPLSIDVNGASVRVAGLRTSKMEPLCDTPGGKGKRKTITQHAEWVINELKKLGVATEELDFEEAGVIEGVMAAVKEAKPYFRFRTSAIPNDDPKQPPYIYEEWKGLAEGYVPDEEANAEVDNTGSNGEAPAEEPAKPAATKTAKGAGTKAAPRAPEPESSTDEEPDLDALAEAADGGDAEAAEKLAALATEAGYDEDTVKGADNWAEVVGLIRLGTDDGTSAEGEATVEEWKPVEGDVYKFKPIDPKTKKPVAKFVECTILEVNEEKKTVKVNRNDTNKPYPMSVKWDALESAD